MNIKYKLENGREIEVTLTEEQIKEIEKTKRKRTGYERVKYGERYFGETSYRAKGYRSLADYNQNCDVVSYKTADYYSDENICKNNVRADSLMRQLRRFSAENGGGEIDWENYKIPKYSIGYEFEKLIIADYYNLKDFGQIYFISKKAAEKAIEIFKDELIWYFTEYQWVLKNE